MRYCIVKFNKREYGIKRTTKEEEPKYMDLNNRAFWWKKESEFFKDCKTDKLKIIEQIFEEVTTKEIEIKCKEV